MVRFPKLGRIALAFGVVTVAAAAGQACSRRPVEAPEAAARSGNEDRIIAEFKARLAKYETVSSKLRSEVFPPGDQIQATEIHKLQKELASRIVKALPEWKQGEIFTPEIASFVRRRLAEALSGPEGANNRAAIFDDAPPPQKVVVMTEYPTGMPVATVPSEILKLLPVLPKELEYRFVGRDLILFDVSAYLMVDVVPAAIK